MTYNQCICWLCDIQWIQTAVHCTHHALVLRRSRVRENVGVNNKGVGQKRYSDEKKRESNKLKYTSPRALQRKWDGVNKWRKAVWGVKAKGRKKGA